MSAMKRNSAGPLFVLVYDSKAPKSLHAQLDDRERWAGHMRKATAEEIDRLKDKRCGHCVTRAARMEADDAKAVAA